MKSQKGFTLLEILLVVGIIAILAGIVIVAINPSKQLASVRNTQRKSDIKAVDAAITQFYIDHSYYPASTTLSTTALMTICPTGASTSPAAGYNCTGLLNLSELVPTYLVSIPNDPATTTTTGYSVMLSNNSPVISASLAELGTPVAIGNVPSGACVATGGTISTSAGYKVHTFTNVGSDTFTVTSGSCNASVLVVAGGGGGGQSETSPGGDGAGGGGAGGLIASSTFSLVPGSITVTVGDGGAGSADTGSRGSNGNDSIFGV